MQIKINSLPARPLFGGFREIRNFIKWLNYCFKWFKELWKAGVNRSRSYLAYELERAVEIQKLGHVERPSKRPTNTFLLQALDVEESFNGFGIAAVARREVDSGMLSVLMDSFLTSEFYMFLSIAVFRLFGADRCTSVLVPYAYKGVEAEVLRGFNEWLVLHEPEYQLPGAAEALCDVETECT